MPKRPRVDEDDGDDDYGITTDLLAKKGNKKHSLDSDEEDEDYDEKKYTILEEDDIEGQEEGAGGLEGEVGITPFNLKEELEEGDFDTEGNYHWKKEKMIKDSWLDNIDWGKVQDIRAMMPDDSEGSDDDDFDEIGTYKEMLRLMRPGETVAKALRRLGGGKIQTASQRWKQKQKAGVDSPQEDRTIMLKLTGLADAILSKMGNMDVYQETYELIEAKIRASEMKRKGKGKRPVSIPVGAEDDDVLDMFADNFDEKEKERQTEGGKGPEESEEAETVEEPAPGIAVEQWEYRKENTEESKIEGPFPTTQMIIWSEDGYFGEGGVWVRRCGQEGPFYNSKRVDFELYI